MIGSWCSGRVLAGALALALALGSPRAVEAQGEAAFQRDTAVVPDIELKTLDGDRVKLHSLLAPRLTLFVMWSTWCLPCIDEMPVLNEFDHTWRDRGVHVVSVFVQDTALALAKRIAQEQKLVFPVLLDDDRLKDAFPGLSLPRGYIVKSDGKVVTGYRPPADLHFIEYRIEYFLEHFGLR